MAELTPLFMDINSVYSGDELGLPYRDLITEGIVAAGDLAVTQRAAGANLSVDVAAGACWVTGDTNPARQPTYRCANDAVVNKGITPDPSNPRRVLIVAQITDETFAGTGRNWQILAIHGTPAASPALPATPASALPLADITVATNATSITNANITDLRVRAGLGGGGSWQAFTPTLVATTTSPTMGAGATVSGRYIQSGKLVVCTARIVFGTGAAAGSGSYRVTLPVAASAAAFALAPAMGIGRLFDSSASVAASIQPYLASVALAEMMYPAAWPTGAFTTVTQAAPWTWADNDQINLQLIYEAA